VRVQLIRAGAGQFQAQELELADGATVADALAATALPREGLAGYAVYGERVGPEAVLAVGDRLELLEPLLADPKDSRRRRAQVQAARTRPR
jgi:hypothetical protein